MLMIKILSIMRNFCIFISSHILPRTWKPWIRLVLLLEMHRIRVVEISPIAQWSAFGRLGRIIKTIHQGNTAILDTLFLACTATRTINAAFFGIFNIHGFGRCSNIPINGYAVEGRSSMLFPVPLTLLEVVLMWRKAVVALQTVEINATAAAAQSVKLKCILNVE